MFTTKMLQGISMQSPCSASWEDMQGNDQVRFCQHCDLSVNDLSAMTTQSAIKLAIRSKGRLCLRIHRDATGAIITRSAAPERLYRITRRASRVVAGAFTAVMGLSSAAYAQSSSSGILQTNRPVASAATVSDADGGKIWLHGTVMDLNGAVVPGAKVTIRNERTGASQETTSNAEGLYGVWVGESASYVVIVESPGFANAMIESITSERILQGSVDAELQPGEVVNGGAMFTVEYVQPLVVAAFSGDLPQVTELLRTGIDANQAEEDGTTALDMAVAHGNLPMAQLLIKSGARSPRAIFWFTQEDDPRLLELLLRSGANINQTSDEGNTPLIMAAYGNDAELIRTLIAAGAAVNSENFAGDSALMIAATYGNEEVVKALLSAGASVSLQNLNGKDALQLAEEEERDEVCELLRAAGATSGSMPK